MQPVQWFIPLAVCLRHGLLVLLMVAASLVGAACSPQAASAPGAAAPAAQRTLTDMAGRSVMLPAQIKRVATVGPVPVINSFVFALGEGGTIVNGLPPFAALPRWKYQTVFAPNIAGAPVMQATNNAPNTEELLKAKPDAVFVMDQSAIAPLDQVNLPTIFLAWRQPEDVKALVNLMAQVYGEPQKGDAYAQYFDATVQRVSARVASVPTDKRKTVLYFSPKNLSQPQLI